MAQSNADIRVRALVEGALSSLSKVEKAIGKIQRVAENIQVRAQGLDKVEAKVNKTNKALKETNRFFQNIARLIAGLNAGFASVLPTGRKLAETWIGVNEGIELSLKNLQGYTREVTKLQKELRTLEQQQTRADNRRLGTIFPRSTLEEEIAEQRGVVSSLKAKDPRFASELSELVRLEQALAENLLKEEMVRERINKLQIEYGKNVRRNINASRQAREASGFKEFSKDLENVIRLQRELDSRGIVTPLGQATNLSSAEAFYQRRKYYDDLATKAAKEQARVQKQAGLEAERAAKRELALRKRVVRELERQQERSAQRVSSTLTGVGFNAMFGGGPASTLGTLFGSLLDPTGGIGGQIFGSVVGQQIDNANRKIQAIGNALSELNVDSLESSFVRINATLKNQINLLRRVGDYTSAQALLQREVANQLGVMPETTQDLATNVNLLGAAWNRFSNSASTTLAILSNPFANTLAAILEVTNQIFRAFNFIASSIALGGKRLSEWVIQATLGEQALQNIYAWLKSFNRELDESVVKSTQMLQRLNETLVANKQRGALNDRLEPGSGIDARINNAQVNYEKEKLRISQELLKIREQINDEATAENKILTAQKLRFAELNAKELERQALVKRDREITAAMQQSRQRYIDEYNRKLEKQQRLEAQSYKTGTGIINSLKIQVAQLAGTNQLLIDQNVAYQKSEQLQARINELLNDEQRSQATLYNQELYRLELRKAMTDEMIRQMNAREREVKALEGVANDNKYLQNRIKYGKEEADIRKRINELVSEGVSANDAERLLRANAELNNTSNHLEKIEQQLFDTYNGIGTTITNGLVDAISLAVTETDRLGEAMRNLAAEILKAIGQALILSAIKTGISGLAGSDGEGFFSFLDGSLKPRANGGPVTAGSAYLVGERGPELFVPGQGGFVANNEDAFGATRAAISGSTTGGSATAEAFADNAVALGYSQGRSEARANQQQLVSAINNPDSIRVSVDTTRVGEIDFVSVGQFQKGMAETAAKARAQVFSDMRHKPSTRSSLGLR